MTANELIALARYRKSVVVPGIGRLPAAWVINMPFCMVASRLPNMKEYYPIKPRVPIALLPAPTQKFYPNPSDRLVCEVGLLIFEREVLCMVGDFAYCWCGSGTSFVPMNIVVGVRADDPGRY